MPFLVNQTWVLPPISWKESLSPVTMTVAKPLSSAWADRVPMMSSASKPGASVQATPISPKAWRSRPSWGRSSSGMGFLVPL